MELITWHRVTIRRKYDDLEGIFSKLLCSTHTSGQEPSEWWDWAQRSMAQEIFGKFFARHDLLDGEDYFFNVWDSADIWNADLHDYGFTFDYHFINSRMAMLFKLTEA